MKQIPDTENALVLRTDFSDEAAWQSVCKAIQEPVGEFQANVDCVSDREYDGLSVEQIVTAAEGTDRSFLFVVDKATVAQADHPILCIDLNDQPVRSSRVLPSEMWSVENNLSLANMDFSDFADNVAKDGIFRGFPQG